MREEVKLLQQVLLGEINPASASSQISRLVGQAEEKSRILPIQRAINCLRDNKYEDFCGNLRQCFYNYEGSLEICPETKSVIEKRANKFGFFINQDDHKYYLNIQPVMLDNYSNLSARYEFKLCKTSEYSLGDGKLYSNFGYKKYLTLTQKLLMYMIANMKANETLLACLPTGGGKSLSWELPALSGQLSGMAIVVVPTIALACDHEKSSQQAFNNSFEAPGKVLAYHSDLDYFKKESLLKDIRDGNVSILYISPEALIGKEFKSIILEAAKSGLVGMLVVDEAHLIVQWGIRFRPEFQMLSAFRNSLEEASPNGIRTLLLSATLNNEDTDIIKKVFASECFTEYRGDELRPEPSYYYHKCKSAGERLKLIEKICAVAPRPIIVYAATPAMASEYYSFLRNSGYENIGLFTGETGGAQRDKLIDQWRANKIDIMVATSAFGMGVDKADVRTVITGYIPENISRFYQEVGRAGRDGYSALNYWLTLDTDWGIVDSLTKNTIITTGLLVDRWKALLRESEHVGASSMWVDANTARDELKHTKTGAMNLGWNEDVILFLLRIGLIEIQDIEKVSKKEFKLLIYLKNIPLLEDSHALLSYIDNYRDEERQRINDGKDSVKRLMDNHTWCYSDFLVEEFPFAEPQCSGCPVCRAKAAPTFKADVILDITTSKSSFREKQVDMGDDLLSIFIESRKHSMVSLDEEPKGRQLVDLVARMVRRGVNIIIYPESINEGDLLTRLASIEKDRYLLLTIDEGKKLKMPWIKGTCALFYTRDNRYNNKLFQFAEEYINSDSENRVIHIAPDSTMITNKRKPLSEIVDCIVINEQCE